MKLKAQGLTNVFDGTMLIADAQVHIWTANTPQQPWARGRKPHRAVPFTKDELRREMDAAGVQRAVLVPPGMQSINDIVLDAAQVHPDRFAAMGRFDFHAPDARGKIANVRTQPGMLGLRLSFRTQENSDNDWMWAEAETANVPVMMLLSPDQLHLMDPIAERHPGLKLVIDHLAIPSSAKDDAAFAHMNQLLALAKHPNIAVKASALPCHTTDSYPYRWLHPHIRRVYDAFGPKRIFWGSDLTRLPCTDRQAVTMITEEIPWLTTADKEWIMGRGLCEWLGWKLT